MTVDSLGVFPASASYSMYYLTLQSIFLSWFRKYMRNTIIYHSPYYIEICVDEKNV